MSDPLDSVKTHGSQLRGWAANAANPEDRAHFMQTADAIDAVVSEVRNLRKKHEPLPTRLGDLSDLPEELRSELSGVELDQLESQIVTVINSYESSTADLNQILVGLFRKFKVIQRRRPLQQRLWRMQQDGLVWAIQGRKGVYTTKLVKPASMRGNVGDNEVPF